MHYKQTDLFFLGKIDLERIRSIKAALQILTGLIVEYTDDDSAFKCTGGSFDTGLSPDKRMSFCDCATFGATIRLGKNAGLF